MRLGVSAQELLVKSLSVGTRLELLRLENKSATAVKVDAPVATAAVAVMERDRAFKHVVLGSGGMRFIDAQELA